MEPTGTYGDAVRHQLVEMGVSVWMVSPKQTHDSQALFDNVRSLHDPKSAVLVARLCAMDLATEWKPSTTTIRTRLRALVERRSYSFDCEERCLGRLEALLARHWPEFGTALDLRGQRTAVKLLSQYATPAAIQSEPVAARELIRKYSKGRLLDAADMLIASSETTLGVPAAPEEELLIASLAREAFDSQTRIDAVEKEIKDLGKQDELFQRLERWMGTFTAAVIVTLCDPRQYTKARQLEKACGLNLREKSSGELKGKLSITKRGPGRVRHVLFLFALRAIQQYPEVRAWYMRRRGYAEESKQRAVVAIMRKLVRALFHVAHGAAFDPAKLFDTRRLELVPRSPLRFGRPRPSPRSGAEIATP
jgi:transposase